MRSVHEIIDTLQRDGLLSTAEAALAHGAEHSGTAEHTLGHEAEVLCSAARDVPKIGKNYTYTGLAQVRDWGYGVGKDGVYELQSPPTMHPSTLALLVYAVTRAGWLPNGTTGMVTAHVTFASPSVDAETVGSKEEVQSHFEQFERILTMIRAIELAGHTTVSRLMSPLNRVEKGEDHMPWGSWNAGGIAGVNIENTAGKTGWANSNRVELRTFGFYSPDQFSRLLYTVYFLSRGLVSEPGSEPGTIYRSYEEWVRSYFADNDLPPFNFELIRDPTHFNSLYAYMAPYARHLGGSSHDKHRAQLSLVTHRAVDDLAEELKMQNFRPSQYAR